MFEDTVVAKLIDIFKDLAKNTNLNFYKDNKVEILTTDKKILLQINSREIILPLKIPIDYFFRHKSALEDKFIEMNKLKELITLIKKQSFLRLNHIGFCYKTDSKEKERIRLKDEVAKTNWHLYEMESTDESLWLFVGDRKYWQDPLIEFLPVEKSQDPEVGYWLPHIHIDVDTNLAQNKIEKIIKIVFKNKIKPYELSIYSTRIRLGVVSGINIMVDLGTNKKDTQYARKYMLKMII